MKEKNKKDKNIILRFSELILTITLSIAIHSLAILFRIFPNWFIRIGFFGTLFEAIMLGCLGYILLFSIFQYIVERRKNA
jgi:type III secretory pathway component EscU